MNVIKKYNHCFTDYYGITRYIDANYMQFHNPIDDSYGTRFVYKFPISMDIYNKSIKVYSEYFDEITELNYMVDEIATIEIDYVDKQTWYAEMMYDGALLPMENKV